MLESLLNFLKSYQMMKSDKLKILFWGFRLLGKQIQRQKRHEYNEKAGEKQVNIIRTQLIDARGRQKQKEVAIAIGISQKHLSKLELGERNPSLITAWKIAEYYGKPLEELFQDVLEESRKQEERDG